MWLLQFSCPFSIYSNLRPIPLRSTCIYSKQFFLSLALVWKLFRKKVRSFLEAVGSVWRQKAAGPSACPHLGTGHDRSGLEENVMGQFQYSYCCHPTPKGEKADDNVFACVCMQWMNERSQEMVTGASTADSFYSQSSSRWLHHCTKMLVTHC